MQANSKKDFSLIKMLIVITMIIILALIAISTYRGRTQKAKSTSLQHDASLIQGLDKSEPIKKPEELEEGEISIYTAEELAKIGHDSAYPLNGTYYLMADLDPSGVGGEEGWVPIGFPKDQNHNVMDTRLSFVGTFDGNGCVIRHLQINRPEADGQGLFSRIGPGAELINIKLEDVNITGKDCTAGLAGQNYEGIISDCYSTGTVTGAIRTGGLVGRNWGTITNSLFTGDVNGKLSTGGLVGANHCVVTDSYFAGTVTGERNTGGLVGLNKGWKDPGTGMIHYATITDCYYLETAGPQSIGTQEYYSSISDEASIKQSSANVKKQSTFRNWDFSNVWSIHENKSYPYLVDNEQAPYPGTD